jgi:hypothetical protein
MTFTAHASTTSDLALAHKAGPLHGQLLTALQPWIDGSTKDRQQLLDSALIKLRDSGQIDHDEYRTIRQIFELLGAPDTTTPILIDRLTTEQHNAERRSASAMMHLFLSIGQDSASRSAVPIAAADLSGGIFGGVVGGPLGALAGAAALSLFTAQK